jgi:hypothetical protein
LKLKTSSALRLMILQEGLSRAVSLLTGYEMELVEMMRRRALAKVTGGTVGLDWKRLAGIKADLETALLRATIGTAIQELKRYRRPADAVIQIVLAVLLLVKDEHVVPFMENLEFALGPRGGNQLSYMWVVARAKLVGGAKKGSLVHGMRGLWWGGTGADAMVVGARALKAMDKQQKEADRRTYHWASKILDRFDEPTTMKASRVLFVLREWIAVTEQMHTMLVEIGEGRLVVRTD